MYQFPWQQAADATVNVPYGRIGMGNPFSYGNSGYNPFSYGSLYGQQNIQGLPWLQGQTIQGMPWLQNKGTFGSKFSDFAGQGGIGSIVNLLGGSPYDKYAEGLHKISPMLQQYSQQALGYLQPYQQAGVKELPLYEQKMEEMADPKAYYNKLMEGYSESPDVQFQKQQALEAIQNRAAATGFTGSGQELKDLDKYSQGIAEQGRQRYFTDLSGIDRQALAALSNITGRGQAAGTQMGSWSMQTGQELASLMAQIANARAKALEGKEQAWGTGLTAAAQAALM